MESHEVSMTPDITPQTVKDIAATLSAARLVIGALRHYAPDNATPAVNYVLCCIGQLQAEMDIEVSPEGNGESDITARTDMLTAVRILVEQDLRKYDADRAPF
jgi:hypothetical protein